MNENMMSLIQVLEYPNFSNNEAAIIHKAIEYGIKLVLQKDAS